MSRLADDFYLMVHDDHTGQLTVGPGVAALGLAAALLGELLLSGHLRVYRDGLYPEFVAPPADRLLHDVVRAVGDPRQDRALSVWLPFLATEAITDVRGRLVADEVLTLVRVRRLTGSRTEYRPANVNHAAWPAIRLAGLLANREAITPEDAVLTGVVQATGLLGQVLWFPEAHAPGWARADQLRAWAPPGIAALLAHTEAAVGKAVLTHRV